MTNVRIRHMMKADFATVVEVERMANTESFEVPGIGRCEALAPWAWTEHDFLNALRSYRSRRHGTYDTRAFVAVIRVTLRDEVPIDIVAGSMLIEIQPEGFEILRLSAHPCDEQTRQAFIEKLFEMCRASKTRHSIRCVVSDGDWESLRFFVKLGWQRNLLPSYFSDGRDGWFVETRVTKSGRPPRRDLAAGT